MNYNTDTRELIEREFSALGFKVLHWNEGPCVNGQDLWVQKAGRRPLSVEIKKAHKKRNKMYQVDPVQKNRVNDDLVAIVLNSEYVLIEPMSDHLKCCSPKGTRQMTLMLAG